MFRLPASENHYLALEKNGQAILHSNISFSRTAGKVSRAAKTFTISFWAKPEINVLLNPNFVLGSISEPWTDYYAIYPPSGEEMFGDGQACCGLTVGRNGIGLWEHGTGQPVLVLP
jgi:hypothetical protein